MNGPGAISITDSQPDLTGARAAFLLAIVLIVGAALRVYHYQGFDHSDEMAYLSAASDLASGDYRFPQPGYGNHAWLRYTVVLPLAIQIRAFGPDDRACAAPFLLASLVAMMVAYGIGRDLCRSRAAGILAAMILALQNKEIAWATRLYPDGVQSLFLAVCMWAVIRSRQTVAHTTREKGNRLAPVLTRLSLLMGLSFALAYQTSLVSIIFLPALATVLIATHPWQRVE